tara:strand:- start:4237 stop:4422 length:186 start_codon:yes stop_codon:yes gene_type:complete
MTETPITIIYVPGNRVSCTGENDDHPKVYYTIPEGGEAVCGYCDIKYRSEDELPKRHNDNG